ncbi:MAG: DUF418 domain-containing protein, partial [Flavobacteriales bacterium]|nr:DUF418 domain-containing protein [Flavobacteriales bacterium]
MNSISSITSKDRIATLDVLRGLALFGVLVGIFSEFIFYEMVISWDSMVGLSTHSIDSFVSPFIKLFITNKANTLFAFLFGLGFYVQWERIKDKRSDAKVIYLRRTLILMLFGAFHLFVMLAWEVLFMYGIIAFILFLMKDKSDKFLLYIGLFLALFGMIIIEGLSQFLEMWQYVNPELIYNEDGGYNIMQGEWGYATLFSYFWEMNLYELILNGSIISYILYALGRFMLGFLIGRKGWIQNANLHIAGFKKVLWYTLPLGLVMGYWSLSIISVYDYGNIEEMPFLVGFAYLIDFLSIIPIATGYICLVVLGMNSLFSRKILCLFAPVGRMALTNYVIMCQSVNFTYFSIGPGLGLAGEIGTTYILGFSIGVFVTLTITSNIWLKYFRFGPLEWCWRALTYKELPVMMKG